MEKKFTKEQVLGFNESDWEWRISSGYAGYDNINHPKNESEWIYEEDYRARKSLKEQYNYEYNLLSEFRDDHVTTETISDRSIKDFLSEKYFI